MRGGACLRAALLLLLPVAAAAQAPDSALRVADLGTCRLESGQSIQQCRVAYRTAGTLNAERSNAVLVPSWFGGGSQAILGLVGPGRLIDTTKWFVIAVDAFGNGASSSPSNSPGQPGAGFPAYTIRDMVHAQHRLAREALGLTRLRAVAGISMGGMQALEWAISYPDFIGAVVSVVGTPRLTSYDLLFWETLARNIEQCQRAGCENTAGLHRRIMALANRTPQERVRITSLETAREWLDGMDAGGGSFDAHDTLSQLRAMLSNDVAAPFGGSLERAGAAIRAELLMVTAKQDHTVRPEPSRELARIVGAQLWESDGDCGHQIFTCETEEIGRVIDALLTRRR